MNLLPSLRSASISSSCALLVACAGPSEQPAQTVVRTPAPVGYEKTITNYLAFRIRGPQKNAELSFSPPEPGACALDGYAASRRGWVVPVVYATRTGEATGRETININTKQYYFWFLGNTIAGITPRIELCPGIEAAFGDIAPGPVAAALQVVPSPAPAKADPQRGEGVAQPEHPPRARAQDRSTGAGGKKHGATSAPSKAGTPSGHRAVKKAGNARGKPKAPAKE